MRIELPSIDLKRQIVSAQKSRYIEIHDSHIIYNHDFWAEEWIDEDDEKMGKEEVYNYCNRIVLKSAISSVEVYNVLESDNYGVLISVMGSNTDVNMYFHDLQAANYVRDQLVSFLLNK